MIWFGLNIFFENLQMKFLVVIELTINSKNESSVFKFANSIDIDEVAD